MTRQTHATIALTLAAIISLTLLLDTSVADAQVGRKSGWTKISKGKLDADWSSLLLYHRESSPIEVNDAEVGTSTTSSLSYLTALTVKYFVLDNIGVGISGGTQIQSSSINLEFTDATQGEGSEASRSDLGFPVMLYGTYYVPLNKNFFFAPAVSGGLSSAGPARSPTPRTTPRRFESGLGGFLGRLDLNVVFYANANLNLRAGVTTVFSSLTETLEVEGADAVEKSFTVFDAGFNAGIGYTF